MDSQLLGQPIDAAMRSLVLPFLIPDKAPAGIGFFGGVPFLSAIVTPIVRI